MRGLSLVAASGGYSSLQCTGFSLRWLLSLQSTGSGARGLSSCGSRALERRLSSCGARASLLRGMWDLPGPGLEPMSPALADGFLTTDHQGSPVLPLEPAVHSGGESGTRESTANKVLRTDREEGGFREAVGEAGGTGGEHAEVKAWRGANPACPALGLRRQPDCIQGCPVGNGGQGMGSHSYRGTVFQARQQVKS